MEGRSERDKGKGWSSIPRRREKITKKCEQEERPWLSKATPEDKELCCGFQMTIRRALIASRRGKKVGREAVRTDGAAKRKRERRKKERGKSR